MPRTGLWMRVFVGLLLAVLPPILLLVGTLLLTESLLRAADPNLVAILIVAGAIVWAGILGVVYARALADDIRSFLSLAERGGQVVNRELGTAYQQMAASLHERNRQIATLASEASAIPIDEEPRRVVGALVAAVRSVMRDPTWRCAVMTSESEELLRPAVYLSTDEPPEPIGELERWASVSIGSSPAGRMEGPWGAFAVVDVSVSDRLGAILYAPWEGRPEPTPAEIAVLALVGHHAGTALEHSLLYARVRSQADELTRLAAVQADFLRGVTHDLQTPLTSIGALATELRANDAVPESARADLATITHQAERLRRMVSQLLVASRLEAGAFVPQVEVFAISPLIERTWSALRADRPFEIQIDGAPHLVVGDPDRVEQVLWAILDNAVKYSPPNSVIKVRVEPRNGHLDVTVQDRGTGMDEKTKAHAFDQFFRSGEARMLAPDGSGVGLFAARGLVEAMSGSISVQSELGSGTAITISLPAEKSEADD